MSETVSKRIGAYELLQPLETDGLSQVFKARCVVGDRPRVAKGSVVALRVLQPLPERSTLCAHFDEWARRLLTCAHPNLVTYLDAFKWRIRSGFLAPCLVERWLAGERLSERLLRLPQGLPGEEVAALLGQAAAGLMFASQHDLLPRRLQPSRMFLTEEGVLKFVGLDGPRPSGSPGATLLGSDDCFDYLAPECARGADQEDETSLVFSFGVCLYQSLTGQLPFPCLLDERTEEDYFDTPAARFRTRWASGLAATNPPLPDISLPRGLPQTTAVLLKCMSVERKDRYHGFADVHADLSPVLRELHSQARERTPTPIGGWPAFLPHAAWWRKPSTRQGLGALAAVLVVLAASAGLALVGNMERPSMVQAQTPLEEPGAERGSIGAVASRAGSSRETLSPRDTDALQPNPLLHHAPPVPGATPPSHPTLRVMMDPVPPGAPPVRVAYRKAPDAEWQPVSERLRITPGVYRLRYTRPDYRPVHQSVTVEPGVKEVVVRAPPQGDWIPTARLTHLLTVERAWQKRDMDALLDAFAEVPNADFEWDAHAARLSHVRGKWFQWLKRTRLAHQETSTRLVFHLPEPPAGEPPIRVLLRNGSDTEWEPLRAPREVAPGIYTVRYERADYLPIVKQVAIPAGKTSAEVIGPALSEWRPGPMLKLLWRIESDWQAADMDALTRRFAQPLSGRFESELHAERFARIRRLWFRRLMAP